MEEQILSCKINRSLYKEVVEYCKKRGIKIRSFVAFALIDELDTGGRYDKKSIK